MRISPFETARSKAAVSSNSEGYARKISGAAFAGSGNSAKPNPALASFPFSARAQFRAVSGSRAETLKYRESDAPNHFAAISAFSIRASLNGRRSKASVLNGAVFAAKNAATHIAANAAARTGRWRYANLTHFSAKFIPRRIASSKFSSEERAI